MADITTGKEPEAHHAIDVFDARRRPGDLAFAVFLFGLSVFLLSQIGEQTRWYDNINLTLQPSFWPGLILIGMTIFSGLYLVQGLFARRQLPASERSWLPMDEIFTWLRPLEYAAYFIIYASVVPWTGYLSATIAFVVLLGLRVGYRSSRSLLSLAAIGLAVVLIFKTGLAVRMPSGAVYELLPDGLRNVFIQYF